MNTFENLKSLNFNLFDSSFDFQLTPVSAPFGNQDAAYLSTLFDFGGIVGGVFAGFISDHSSMSACTCAFMLIAAVPVVGFCALDV